VLTEASIGELVVDLGALADVDEADQTTVSGLLLNYVAQARVGRAVVRSSSASNVARGIVAVGCDRPRLYDVRGEGLRRAVQLTDTVGARVSLDLGGADCTSAVVETGTTDQSLIDGDLGTASVALVGSDSRLVGTAYATGTTENKAGLQAGRTAIFADSFEPNNASSTLPLNRAWEKGDLVFYNSEAGAGTATSWRCSRAGYAWPQGAWAGGTAYAAGAQVRASDLSVYRAVQASTGEDPTTDDGTYWLELGTYAAFIAQGIARLKQTAALDAGTATVSDVVTALKGANITPP
jgi:hypothetical protein